MTPAEPSAPPGGSPCVSCAGVRRTYRLNGSSVAALRGVDMRIHPGTFTALVGPSGSGKSTLLRLIACVDRADTGRVEIEGREVTALGRRARAALRRRRIGFIFQNPADNLLEYLTVRQHLILGAQLRGLPAPDRHADPLLDLLGLTARARHLPRQLSGGEQQRVAIAFAAIGPPAVLIADEPTGQLDHKAGGAVLDAIQALTTAGMAVLAATHDPALARRADRVITMRDGTVRQEGDQA